MSHFTDKAERIAFKNWLIDVVAPRNRVPYEKALGKALFFTGALEDDRIYADSNGELYPICVSMLTCLEKFREYQSKLCS